MGKVLSSFPYQDFLTHFPHTANLQEMTENILAKPWKISINKSIINEELKTLWQMEKLLFLSNFCFVSIKNASTGLSKNLDYAITYYKR